MTTDDDLPTQLGRPALAALRAAGVSRTSELATWSEAELRALHGVGPKAIRIITELLERRGLSLKRP